MTDDKQKILLTGLWARKDEKGEIYYTGALSYGAQLLMFKNDKKSNERSPDVMLYLVSKESEDQGLFAGSKGEIPF